MYRGSGVPGDICNGKQVSRERRCCRGVDVIADCVFGLLYGAYTNTGLGIKGQVDQAVCTSSKDVTLKCGVRSLKVCESTAAGSERCR